MRFPSLTTRWRCYTMYLLLPLGFYRDKTEVAEGLSHTRGFAAKKENSLCFNRKTTFKRQRKRNLKTFVVSYFCRVKVSSV